MMKGERFQAFVIDATDLPKAGERVNCFCFPCAASGCGPRRTTGPTPR